MHELEFISLNNLICAIFKLSQFDEWRKLWRKLYWKSFLINFILFLGLYLSKKALFSRKWCHGKKCAWKIFEFFAEFVTYSQTPLLSIASFKNEAQVKASSVKKSLCIYAVSPPQVSFPLKSFRIQNKNWLLQAIKFLVKNGKLAFCTKFNFRVFTSSDEKNSCERSKKKWKRKIKSCMKINFLFCVSLLCGSCTNLICGFAWWKKILHSVSFFAL